MDGYELDVRQDSLYDYEEYLSVADIMRERIDHFNFLDECVNLVKNCMGSVLIQSFSSLLTLFSCCALLRLAVWVMSVSFQKQSYLHFNILNVLGSFLGMICFISISNDQIYRVHGLLIVLSFILSSYMCMYLLSCFSYKCTKSASIFTVVFLICGELSVQDTGLWHQIRGVLLVLAMKYISVAIDVDRQVITELPSSVSYIAYCLHCGTLLFGPWVPFASYRNSVEKPHELSIQWMFYVLKGLMMSYFCLLLSTCVLCYLFIDGTQPELPFIMPYISNYWMLSYQSAVSFHFSHFYICYLSQATCMMSGVAEPSDCHKNVWSKFAVVRPISIIFPSSLVNLVVDWNVPMSKWLKDYVFNAYKHLGQTSAVLLTYAASAILHGLSFHLASVLLSLSFYTYVEYTIRSKLSCIFNCEHIRCRKKSSSKAACSAPFLAYLFNIMWVLINIMHLTYLGSMFQSGDDEAEKKGYHMTHTIAKWKNLDFISPIFASICYIISVLLPSTTKMDQNQKKE